MDWIIELTHHEAEAAKQGRLTHLIKKSADNRLVERDDVVLVYGDIRLKFLKKMRSHLSYVAPEGTVIDGYYEPLTLKQVQGAGFADEKAFQAWAMAVKVDQYVNLLTLQKL